MASTLDVVVYPQDIDGAELAFSRLGWPVAERFADGPDDHGVIFHIPVERATLELVTHDAARSLSAVVGSDVVAGLRLSVDDATAAWQGVRAAGFRLDPVCADGPSTETWGMLVRAYTPGGLRLDLVAPLPPEAS